MAQFEHKLLKLASMRYKGVPLKGLLHQLQETVGLRGRERKNKYTNTYTHACTHPLHPTNFSGTRDNHRGNLARKCLARHQMP